MGWTLYSAFGIRLFLCTAASYSRSYIIRVVLYVWIQMYVNSVCIVNIVTCHGYLDSSLAPAHQVVKCRIIGRTVCVCVYVHGTCSVLKWAREGDRVRVRSIEWRKGRFLGWWIWLLLILYGALFSTIAAAAADAWCAPNIFSGIRKA